MLCRFTLATCLGDCIHEQHIGKLSTEARRIAHSKIQDFHSAADTSFAEEAALKPREDGSSDDFMTWFNFQRLFQFNTWGHLALVISFVVFQLVPFILATVFSFLRAISGVPTRPTEAADDAVSKTFQQALSDGDISVRSQFCAPNSDIALGLSRA